MSSSTFVTSDRDNGNGNCTGSSRIGAAVTGAVSAAGPSCGGGHSGPPAASASSRGRLVNYTLTRADNRNAWHTRSCTSSWLRGSGRRVFMRPVSPALSAGSGRPVNYR
ncbi:hypothetical protein KM043_007061 [Ampulex compressa]|nr:hypothetical protein KM043_007061 [Ampulex compressa]